MKINKKTILKIFFTLLIFTSITGAGVFTGVISGGTIMSGFVSAGTRVPFVFFTPSLEFFNIYRMINSPDEMERLSGYYSLYEKKIPHVEFLSERFDDERSVTIKRTIIWIIGGSQDRAASVRFFERVFDLNDTSVKTEIIKSLKRYGKAEYDEFIKKHPGSEKISID